jgi:TetR/AcrR family transcriptional regulator, cholesterol catabolism regulator
MKREGQMTEAKRRRPVQAEPGGGLVYWSPAIIARRQRILEETRIMIAERGLAGFSMDDLCKRAGVAKRTLYNAYQTKERMIALAIKEYFENYADAVPFTGPVGSIKRNIDRIIFIYERNRNPRNYSRALAAIYFSPEVDRDLLFTMHQMTVEANLEWIMSYKAKRQLHPWIDAVTLANDIVRTEYALLNDWCRSVIPDEEIIHHHVRACLTIAAGATRGEARREIEDLLQRYHESPLALSGASSSSANRP